MKNMYSFRFNVGGFKIIINVISDSIENSAKKAYERCADNVGDAFKTKALNGGYLQGVDVTHDVLTDS